MNKVKPIPEGFRTLTPILVVHDGMKALDFYKKALDAKIMFKHNRPDGKLMHASLKIGDSMLMLGEECEPHPGHDKQCSKSPMTLKGTSVGLYIYVENSDAAFDKAVKAGGKVTMPMADMFWGDRAGQFKDPFGHSWFIATKKEDVSPEELDKRAKEMFCKEAACK